MARIRSIKPEIYRDRQIARISRGARWTFAGLCSAADDEGRYEDDARLLKADVYPLDDITASDVEADLAEMETAELICRYETNGHRYLHILRFRDDDVDKQERSPWGQRPQKPQPSRHPACGNDHGEIQETLFSATGPVPVQDQSPTGTGPISENPSPRDQVPSTKYQVPSTKYQGPTRVRATAADIARFSEFYAAYPRHTSRAAAEKSWASALERGVPPDIVIAAASRYAADPNRVDEYTKHPATWLNQACWDDDPLPSREGDRAAPRRSTTDDRVRQGMELAAKYDRMEQRAQAVKGELA